METSKSNPSRTGHPSFPTAWAQYLAATRGIPAGSQSGRIMVQIAHQAGVGDPDGSAILLTLLTASRSICRLVENLTGLEGLSQPRLATLLALYALDPVPCTPADLAYHAEVSRASMTRIIDTFEQRGWLTRDRSHEDRRHVPIRLTAEGLEATKLAIHQFIHVATAIVSDLSSSERKAIVAACDRLRRRVAGLEAPSNQLSST